MNNTQNQQLKVAWKNAYANIAQATAQIRLENGGTLVGAFSNMDDVLTKYSQHLNFVKRCKLSNYSNNCWSDKTYYLKGGLLNNDGFLVDYHIGTSTTGATGLPSPSYSAVLSSGTSIAVAYIFNQCDRGNGGTYPGFCGSIYVDVNGVKTPNTLGKDVFIINLFKDKVLPAGAYVKESLVEPRFTATCIQKPETGWDSYANSGAGCSAIYLKQ